MAVDAPAGRSTYSYAVFDESSVTVGQLVWVPFGTRTVRGIVVGLNREPTYESPRPILSVSPGVKLTPFQIDLGEWIAAYYLSPQFSSLSLFLPPGMERQPDTYVYRAGRSYPEEPDALSARQRRLLQLVGWNQRVRLKDLERSLGKTQTSRDVDSLVRRGLLAREDITRERSVGTRTDLLVSLSRMAREYTGNIQDAVSPRAIRQREVLAHLRICDEAVPLQELRDRYGTSRGVVRTLEDKGLVDVYEERVWRSPLEAISSRSSSVPALTDAQHRAQETLAKGMTDGSFGEYLLFGVTGSGKTELYLRATGQALSSGRSAVCLVPEITLASQTVERFMSRFPNRVILLHSGLSPGEQVDEWERVSRTEPCVVIGPRSALFAPVKNPGLIVLDEEHEWTYKQDDMSPRYHARTVAREMAVRLGIPLVLGSATPDVETFTRVVNGRSQLLELPYRIGDTGLPPIEVVNMRDELRDGNVSLFSGLLLSAMKEALSRSEQVLLFLNRRGTATLVQCRRCGHVFACPRCSVALAYHAARGRLICHRCGYSSRTPEHCPQCKSTRIRYLGVGTQRIVDEVHSVFPGARVVRWDSDVPVRTRGQSGFNDAVHAGEVDVIVGTQMVAKGLDFPNVTLVGAISADLGLTLPDYRAGERTFQLLCQVAGRAGRGLKPGRVVAQVYEPDSYVIKAAAAQDYRTFYEAEMKYRRDAFYPPFCSVVRLMYAHTNDDRSRAEAARIYQQLSPLADDTLRVTGPIPAFMHRLRGRYRWQVIVRGSDPASIVAGLTLPNGWVIDVDPLSVA
ncbi:MAG: replication restart helicase PriA [Chloroflexota bacterium]